MTTPSKPDLVALAPCPFCGGEAEHQPEIGVRSPGYWIRCTKCKVQSDDRNSPEGAAAKWNTRLASQPSPYEAGQRDMQERAAKAAYSIPEYMGTEGPISPGSPYDRGRFDAACAIASLPVGGGEVDYDTNDPMGVEKDIQSSDGGCICCANGNDLPDGEYCRVCGRENNLYPLAAAVKKARGIMAPPTKPVKFAGPSEATPSSPAPSVRPDPTSGEAVRALEPWRDELSEIIGHLGSAIVQACDKDDQIIMDHVKAAHEIAKIVRRKA